ncbi:RTX toxin [Vibrio galatheae]|uniref:RTX toxin n=1 Tax=Vibrio galatheae TaxID=579748 RepID=A0A0F4NLQ9_9VIBR|nr:type I secretion C-terminal target domain-containing protein [Vibrio galatheae]KJY82981.1 RTX toxin [Vibrio galatheae]
MRPILYIEIGDVIWQIMPDGTWEQAQANSTIEPDVLVITPLVSNQDVVLTPEQEQAVEEQLAQIVDELTQYTFNNRTGEAYAGANQQASQSASFINYVQATLQETLAQAGFDTRPDDIFANDDEQPEPEVLDILNQNAQLTVDILDGGDGYENRFESPGVVIKGTALNIRDGRIVNITITDINGNTVTTSAITNDEAYLVSGVNLTSLAEGPLKVSAVVADNFGNSVSATDDTIKDTLAAIDVDFDGGGDEYYNQFEVSNGALSGSVSFVQNGQPISVQIIDSLGQIIKLASVVDGGNWSISAIDVSSLAEGTLTVIAETIDIAGNPAIAQDTITKDTLASITANVEDGGDDVVNITEKQSLTFSGAVSNVENGQPVHVVITDSNNTTLEFDTVVIGGQWSVDNVDVSSFVDGAVTVTASTVDIAGNPATYTDNSTIIDTSVPTIDIDTLSGFSVLDFRQGNLTTMQGTTTGVDAGLMVTITVSDGTLELSFEGVVDGSGAWSVTDIDTSALDIGQTWTVEASVFNAIGNQAIDDMPTIVLPDSLSFSETVVGIFGSQEKTSDINIEFAEFGFYADQSLLENNVTSQNSSITVSISGDSQSLEGRNNSNELVFAAQIVDGEVRVTFYRAIDQGTGLDSLQTALLIQGVQTDADGTTETVIAHLPITVKDSDPLVFGENYTMTEGTTSSGNLLNNDIDLDTQLLVREVEVDGVTKTITGSQPVSFTTSDGVLTVFANGQWTFEASRNLDHNLEHTISINYIAGDSSSDFGTATAEISILDGGAGDIQNGSNASQEASLDEGVQTLSATFAVDAGSDNPDPATLEFDSGTLALLDAMGLQSTLDLADISYTLSADGKVITATSGSDTIFTLTLSAVANGDDVTATVTLDQSQPILHLLASDAIVLPLSISGTDLDGTPLLPGTFEWIIHDGQDPALSNASSVTINESDLAAAPLSQNGTFEVSIGSDYLDSVFFDLADQPALSSGGRDIVYVLNSDGSLSAYTEDLNTRLQPDELVFNVYFDQPIYGGDATVTYTVELHQALDQLDGNSQIPIVVTAQDRDGDQTKLTLDISVNDGGAPSIGSGNVELSEVPRASGIDAEATAEVSFNVSAAFDPLVYLGLAVSTGEAVLDSNGDAITHNGQAVTWRDNGDGSYDAVIANGQIILSVSLPSDFILGSGETASVDVRLELYQQIDHIGSGNDLSLNIPVPVYTVDSDGTENTVQSSITIYDGADPRIEVAGSISVDEDELTSSNLDIGSETVTPSITLLEGSDDIVSLNVDRNGFDGQGYTSGGSAVSLNDVDVNGWYYGITASGDDVFKIRFNLDGSVEFELYRPLDHDTGLGENNLALTFGLTATDADGDVSASVDYTVNVTDDVPTSYDSTLNLVEGDTQSGNMITVFDRVGADGGELVSVSYDVDGDGNAEQYLFSDANPSYTIALYNPNSPSESYGSLTVNRDGSYTLVTNASVDADPALNDALQMVVRDFDGDEATSTVSFVLGDNDGFIRVADAETTEDNSVTLSIEVSTGDIDQQEQVTEIAISEASLQGGSIYLDGVLLTAVNGKVSLTGSQLDSSNPSLVVPNGTLTYLPPENQSDTTISISLAISAVISTDTVPRDLAESLDVSVLPIADTPEWGQSQFTYSTIEDADQSLSLDITANLVDLDGSEALKYEITNIPSGITVTLNGTAITEGKQYTQAQLDQMKITADDNVAGSFNFDIKAIAIEDGNNFASSGDKTAEITSQVVVNVRPDADTPTLEVKDIKGLEDDVINLKDYILSSLTDTDGSESLRITIQVPDGWSVAGGDYVGNNQYSVTSDALAAGSVTLVPKQDISSYTESLSIDVTAVSIESTQDGLIPSNPQASSATETIQIYLKGVVDEPTVVDGGEGHWQYDANSKVISNQSDVLEDQLIALDFLVQTTDDDASEEINILLTDIPDGTQLVDASGNPVTLTIASIDDITGPVYQVSNADLSTLYLKPVADFSGQLTLSVIAISTEPDGDSGEYPMTVEIEVLPQVDQVDGQVIATQGIEDRLISLSLEPSVDADQDGSEALTGYMITSLDAELTLYFDGVEIDLGTGLDLSTLLDATSPTLDSLLASGRLSVLASEDLSGVFNVGIRYQVTDTSETLATTESWIDGTLSVNVSAKVELDTRLESSGELYSSTDGSPVDISDSVIFVDEDLDGSEYLDYIIIVVPDGYTLIVDHPNGASQDGDGNWLIPASGLTSDTFQESVTQILNGATLSSTQDTPVLDIVVRARVLDGSDDRFIDTSFQFQVTGNDGGGGGCDPVGTPGNVQSGDIKQPEGDEIDLSGLLNSDVASDPDNILSFYIPADSLPEGVEIQGSGVTAEYDRLGNVIGYSITASALDSLVLTGVDEDFAGTLIFTVETIETSGCNGTSVTTEQTITIQITPVVDDIAVEVDIDTIQEDAVTNLDLSLVLGDSIETGQLIEGEGTESTGKETVNSLMVTVTSGATLSGPVDVLQDNGDGTWSIIDPSRLNEVSLVPPAHYSGDVVMTFTANITDQATGIAETDTQDKTTTVTIHIEPVADEANLVTQNVLGSEDNYISLGAMSASLIDQDGSESLSLSITGVPEGAVIVYKVGDSYELAANNGGDGGSFNGKDTYEWQLDPTRLADVYLRPPLDFSGDIPLSLEATTQELENSDVNFTSSEFTVGVLPVGDRVELVDLPDTLNGSENDGVNITLNATSFETNSDEYLLFTFIIEPSSDATALIGLDRIRVGLQTSVFLSTGDGRAVASVQVKASEIDQVTFFPGDAFGEFDVTISISSFDQAIVLGNLESDTGDATTESLTLTITPEPDPPTLTLDYDTITADADGNIPLGLNIELINPASNETGRVIISGLPSGLVLNAGTLQNGKYSVDMDDVADLAIVGGYDGAVDFQLSIEPISTIGSDSASGVAQVIDVSLQAPSDVSTNLSGTNGVNDLFVIGQTTGTDTISSFEYSADSDSIDLSAILNGVTDGASAALQIDISESGSDVVLDIKPDGSNVQQSVVIADVSLNDLAPSLSSEAEILQKMIDDQNLIVQ